MPSRFRVSAIISKEKVKRLINPEDFSHPEHLPKWAHVNPWLIPAFMTRL